MRKMFLFGVRIVCVCVRERDWMSVRVGVVVFVCFEVFFDVLIIEPPCVWKRSQSCVSSVYCTMLFICVWYMLYSVVSLVYIFIYQSSLLKRNAQFFTSECMQRNINCLLIVKWPKMGSLFVILMINGDVRCKVRCCA